MKTAATEKPTWVIPRQRDFTGGENLSDLPELIGVNQFAKLENAMISPEGYLVDVFQADTAGIASGTQQNIKGIVFDQMPSTTQFNYWHTTGLVDKVYTGTYNPGTPVNIDTDTPHACTGADIKGLAHTVNFLGKKYCINNGGGVLDLSSFAVISTGNLLTMPLVKLKSYVNKLWGVTTDGNLIFSKNGDASVWDALDILRLPSWEKAIDFIPVQGGAIVYSRTSVYAMYGSDYTDISLVPLLTGTMLSDGAVELNNNVYILGNRGVYQVNLNGVQEIPHTQNKFFKANYLAWTANETGNVAGIYLYKYHAIMYLFRSDVGTQGFIYYLNNGAFCKVNTSLHVNAPFMMAVEHGSIDYLIYKNYYTVCEGKTPSGTLLAARTTRIKTGKMDFGTSRVKVVREFAINVAQIVYNVTINFYADDSATPINVYTGNLAAGDNVFFMDSPRCNMATFDITIASDTSHSAAFTIREMRTKVREAGYGV